MDVSFYCLAERPVLKGSLLSHYTSILSRYILINRFHFGSRSRASRASPGISIGQNRYNHDSCVLYLELRQCPALPVRLQSRESNPKHFPSLLVTTPRRWPFPIGTTVLDGFRTPPPLSISFCLLRVRFLKDIPAKFFELIENSKLCEFFSEKCRFSHNFCFSFFSYVQI